MERYAIRQLGTDGQTVRRAKDNDNLVSLVQALPRDNDTWTASGCEGDPVNLARFDQCVPSSLARRRPKSIRGSSTTFLSPWPLPPSSTRCG
jgi:hypothetical protein